MSRVATLKESRDDARAKLTAVTDRLDAALAERSWTPEEEAELADAEKRFEQVSKAYKTAKKDEERAEDEAKQRAAKLGAAGEIDVRDGIVHVGNEPLTYSKANPQNSFYRDLLYSAMPQSPAFDGARARLMAHHKEISTVAEYNGRGVNATTEGRAALNVVGEIRRRVSGREQRAVSTASTSMGDFAPPLYFLTEYAPYRDYGRTLISQLKSHPMPETGMTFNVPRVTTPTEAAQQTSQNTFSTTRTMVSTYDTGTLATIIDNLKVSQQYLDRVGPGIGGDQIVHDDQTRQVNRQLNIFAWNKLLTKIKSTSEYVVYSTTAFNAQIYNQKVHKGEAAISKLEGTVAYPTHLFTTIDLWETVEGSYDSSNRPYVVPQGVAFNPLAVGDNAGVPEGYTGFHFAGLPAFKDQAMFVSWKTTSSASSGTATCHPTMVGALDIGAFWLEGAPVVRVLPQPYAATLTVLIQEFVYCALIVVYPGAFQVIVGTGTTKTKLSA